MAKDLFTSIPVAKNTLEEAVETLKPLGVGDLSDVMFNGPLVGNFPLCFEVLGVTFDPLSSLARHR